MFNKSTLFRTPDMADVYLKHRPTYDPHIVNTIIDFCKETIAADDFSLAIDVACGSGHMSVPLTEHFPKVLGVDISEAQISKAPTDIPGLTFRVGPGEDLSFVGAGSADLVMAAAALHWLDVGRFQGEVERILKPGGSVAVVDYVMPDLDDPQATQIIHDFDEFVLEKYLQYNYEKEAKDLYQTYSPFPGCQRLENVRMERSYSVDEFMGFLYSWTSHHKHCLENQVGSAATDIRKRLRALYGDGEGRERQVKATFSVKMVMGHKPLA